VPNGSRANLLWAAQVTQRRQLLHYREAMGVPLEVAVAAHRRYSACREDFEGTMLPARQQMPTRPHCGNIAARQRPDRGGVVVSKAD